METTHYADASTCVDVWKNHETLEFEIGLTVHEYGYRSKIRMNVKALMSAIRHLVAAEQFILEMETRDDPEILIKVENVTLPKSEMKLKSFINEA